MSHHLLITALTVAAAVLVLALCAGKTLRRRAGLGNQGGSGVRQALAPALCSAGLAGVSCAAVGPVGLGLLAFAVLALVTPYLGAADLRQHRLPEALTLPTAATAAGAFILDALTGAEARRLGLALLAGVISWVCFAGMRWLSRGGMGLGDVTLAGVLGVVLGWLSTPVVVLGLSAGFIFAALALVPALVMRRVSRGARVPFGPFMLIGAWTSVVAFGLLRPGASLSWWLALPLGVVPGVVSMWTLHRARRVDASAGGGELASVQATRWRVWRPVAVTPPLGRVIAGECVAGTAGSLVPGADGGSEWVPAS